MTDSQWIWMVSWGPVSGFRLVAALLESRCRVGSCIIEHLIRLSRKSCAFLTNQRRRGVGRDLHQVSKNKVLPFLDGMYTSCLVLTLSSVLTRWIPPHLLESFADETQDFLLGRQVALPLSSPQIPITSYSTVFLINLMFPWGGGNTSDFSVSHVALQQSFIVILSFGSSDNLQVFVFYPVCFVSYHLLPYAESNDLYQHKNLTEGKSRGCLFLITFPRNCNIKPLLTLRTWFSLLNQSSLPVHQSYWRCPN